MAPSLVFATGYVLPALLYTIPMNLRRIPRPLQFFAVGVLVGLVIGVAFASMLRWIVVIGVIVLIVLAVVYLQQFFARQKR